MEKLSAEKAALEAAKVKLQNELEDLQRQHGLLQGDLEPGATAQDARPNCETCGDKGYEMGESMDVIPCRKCVG